MEPRVTVQGRSLSKFQDESNIRSLPLGRFIAISLPKLCTCPHLPLIFTEVLDDERSHAGNREQSLARGMNGESAEVTSDPPAVQFFRHRSRSAATAKAIEH